MSHHRGRGGPRYGRLRGNAKARSPSLQVYLRRWRLLVGCWSRVVIFVSGAFKLPRIWSATQPQAILPSRATDVYGNFLRQVSFLTLHGLLALKLTKAQFEIIEGVLNYFSWLLPS